MKRIMDIDTLNTALIENDDFRKMFDRRWKEESLYKILADNFYIIGDDNKVYEVEECYSPDADRTFIMKQEFFDFDSDEGEAPKLEFVNWYFGEPNADTTERYLRKESE